MSLDAKYLVKKATTSPTLDDQWDDAAWAAAETLNVQWGHSASAPNAPRPVVQAKLQYDAANIYGIYKVDDVSVRATHTVFNSSVCQDSCVEFFFRPGYDQGPYFNLEMSIGGTYLSSFIRDWTRTPDGFVDFTPLSPEDGRLLGVKSTRPGVIDPEEFRAQTWQMRFQIPLAVLEKYWGAPLALSSGTKWSANFYKCADRLAHPHWMAWQPLEPLNFHQPKFFGTIQFE